MKKGKLLIAGLILASITSFRIYAQENNKGINFNPGLDLQSSYIFRGTRFGQGPAVQPNFKITGQRLTFGVWGSFDASGYAETDPYISYSFPFGLTLGLTDYYYPGLQAFDISELTGSHALEINTGFAIKNLSLSANYIINEAGGAGSSGKDKYFQAGYSFSVLNIFVGAGDGWHTTDGKFDLCNIGIGASRQIVISDKFSIPLTGQIILNPDREQLYVVIGLTI